LLSLAMAPERILLWPFS